MTTTDTLQTLAADLSMVDEDTSDITLGELWQRVQVFKADTKRLYEMLDEAMLAWLSKHANSLDVGELRIYAGKTKSIKCLDKARVLGALLASDNNPADFLVSQPYLPARVRDLMPACYEESFAEEISPDVRVKAAPKAFIKAKQEPPAEETMAVRA